MTYKEKLQSPKWQKKRLQIFERDDWKCQTCINGQETLVVHHKQYIEGNEPWEYPDQFLITLCKTCHGKIHSSPIKKFAIRQKVEGRARKIKNISIKDTLRSLNRMDGGTDD